MAYDKVVDSSALDSKLTAIANAIRAKTGSTGTLTLDQMPTEIAGIETGGGEISEDDYVDLLLTTTVSEIDSDVTAVRGYACHSMSSLVTVNLPNATTINTYAFNACSSLTSVNAPNVRTIGVYAFYSCRKITEIVFPLLTAVSTACLGYCTALVKADFAIASSVAPQSLRNTTSLKALILRKTDAIATLSNVNAFTSSTVESGTGYIYVPRALVDTYKAATNWSTYASQIRALEDYTVDGTTTGALDESKI